MGEEGEVGEEREGWEEGEEELKKKDHPQVVHALCSDQYSNSAKREAFYTHPLNVKYWH